MTPEKKHDAVKKGTVRRSQANYEVLACGDPFFPCPTVSKWFTQKHTKQNQRPRREMQGMGFEFYVPEVPTEPHGS